MILKNTYTISAVIRTYNEAKYIGQVIEILRSQNKMVDAVEIIIVDSGSTDGTIDIVKNHRVRLIEIPKEEFNYSKSLNLGIESSQGEFIFILSGHSIPSSENWASRIINHFTDSKVAGVYCRQMPWDDANWHEIYRINATFGKRNKMFTSSVKDNMSFSNAASCIRRSVWQKHGFQVLPAAEDKEWAQWALEKGYKIVYDAGATVYHSHNESARRAAKRLIEIEKSIDIRKQRKRTILLTIYQAFHILNQLVTLDLKSQERIGKKAQALFVNIKFSIYFIIDFKR